MAAMNLEASLLTKRLLYQYISSYPLTVSYRPLKALRIRRHRPAITDSIVAKSKQSNSRIFVSILSYFQRILSFHTSALIILFWTTRPRLGDLLVWYHPAPTSLKPITEHSNHERQLFRDGILCSWAPIGTINMEQARNHDPYFWHLCSWTLYPKRC